MAVVSMKCPNCAAPIAFDIAAQKWECKFCDSSFGESEVGLFEKQTDSQAEHWSPDTFTDDEAAVYNCPGCGGRVIADKNTAATFCAYCHSPAILSSRLSGEFRPARLIPFKLVRDEAVASMQKLCKRKILLPKAFRSAMEKGEITGLYVPFWLYSADVEADFNATGKQITTWSDSNYRYTKTDTYHVEREMTIPLRLVPVDASARMDDKLMDALEPFDYNDLIEFSMEYLSGVFAESYDIDSTDSAPRFLARARAGAKSAVDDTTRRYTVVEKANLRTDMRGMDCIYVMLPVWTLMTQYRGKTYYLAMNGQTGKSAGRLPICGVRAARLFGIVAAAVAVIGLIGGLL
ncbi:MAG: hypothetical protein FWH00_03390 [Oscillospiraceae bacterium]|nr:hypothetical protein [Oscillospiraceae bacterium]